jgi:NADH:ubiquinone oxidoreductase subunit 6 (subunit J)
LLGVTAGLSGALWVLVYIGAVINIAVTWCFHLHNQRIHIWMTALTSALLGLMIFLLLAMDHPYLGKLSVSL